MELTGKCKEDFEKWYSYHIYSDTHHIFGIQEFYNAIPKSMQFGVYVDFFDSVGIRIELMLDVCYTTKKFRGFWFFIDGHDDESETYTTRAEARTATIEKANEIYNQTK